MQIKPAAIAGGTGNRAVEIEFGRCALAGETTQATKRHLDVAHPQFDAVVEIAEFALLPDLDRCPVAHRFATDADALRMVATMPIRRRPGGADPFAATGMPLLLFGEPLLQLLEQFFVAQFLQLEPVFLRQVPFGRQPQPVLGHHDIQPRQRFNALEIFPEGAVETVVQGLILDQQCP